MSRSKIFLGISFGVLAIVTFTAAKVARFSGLYNAYYHGAATRFCTRLASLQFYSIPWTSSTLQATAGPSSSPSHARLYTFSGGGFCLSPLYALGPIE
jgi:hypothetical protein